MVLNLIPPLAFGVAGKYHFLGMSIGFVNTGTSRISRVALGLFSGHYFNFLLHEIGHNLALWGVYGRFGEISLYSNGAADCSFQPYFHLDSKATAHSEALISLAGPLSAAVFGTLRAVAIRQSMQWVRQRRNGGRLTRFESIAFTALKIQNLLGLCINLAELAVFFSPHSYSRNRMANGGDFMQIYHFGGASSAILSTILVVSISALTIKLMRTDIPTAPPSLRARAYRIIKTVIDRTQQAAVEAKGLTMRLLKSAVHTVAYPLLSSKS